MEWMWRRCVQKSLKFSVLGHNVLISLWELLGQEDERKHLHSSTIRDIGNEDPMISGRDIEENLKI